MFAPKVGQFPAILTELSSGNRPRITDRRRFRRWLDGFRYSPGGGLQETVQTSPERSLQDEAWTLSYTDHDPNCRKLSTLGIGHHRWRLDCPGLGSNRLDPEGQRIGGHHC